MSSNTYISFLTMSVASPTPRENSCACSTTGVRILAVPVEREHLARDRLHLLPARGLRGQDVVHPLHAVDLHEGVDTRDGGGVHGDCSPVARSESVPGLSVSVSQAPWPCAWNVVRSEHGMDPGTYSPSPIVSPTLTLAPAVRRASSRTRPRSKSRTTVDPISKAPSSCPFSTGMGVS